MEPTMFIGPQSALGAPAPYWLIVFFKVLGFTLHQGPMHLWFAGLLCAMLLKRYGGAYARRQAERLMAQMPFIISIGVNLGIVPLLFLQVSNYQVFYPATIFMAWAWISIIAFLAVAYYGVYVYAIALKTRGKLITKVARWTGWLSAVLFLIIGFIFSNAMSLMTNVAGWEALWKASSVAGAPLGIRLNVADPTLWPRYLMMFGLALVTLSAYLGLDAALFAAKETAGYKRRVGGFSWKLGLAGVLWFAACGSWYVFGTWQAPLREAMLAMPLLPLTVLTAIGPGLTWIVLWLNRAGASRTLALAAAFMQFAVLALNAVSRQIVQNRELARYLDLNAAPVSLQLSPLIVFLVLFAGGIALTVWMIRKAVEAQAKPVAR